MDLDKFRARFKPKPPSEVTPEEPPKEAAPPPPEEPQHSRAMAAMYAPGKAKRYKGWMAIVHPEGEGYAFTARWGAIDNPAHCSREWRMTHNSTKHTATRADAIDLARTESRKRLASNKGYLLNHDTIGV